MPLYDFRCNNCNSEVEKRVSISESERTDIKCDNCNSGKLVKLVGAPGVVYNGKWFKNSGGY